MKGNIKQLKTSFWVLGLISSLSAYMVFQKVVHVFFPSFLLNVCGGTDDCNWSLLEGYASTITLAILIGGLVFTIWEYFRQESQLSFQIYESLNAKLTNPSEEAARRWIYENIKPIDSNTSKEEWLKKTFQEIYKRPKNWTEELAPGHRNVKMTLNTLDYIGFIAENYVNVDGPQLEWMSPPIAKVWERLEPYVENERQERGEPDYYKSAFYIGKKCVAWRKKKGLKSEIIEKGI